MTGLLLLWLFPTVMAVAAVSDLLTMTIPNRLSLALAAGFVLACFAAGLGVAEVGWHLSAGAAMLALGFAFFAFGWIGGGDAKLFAAAALWFGWDRLLDYALAAGIIGGLLTVVILAVRRAPVPSILMRQDWVRRLVDPGTGIPYGIALATAAIALYPRTAWFALAAGG